jgi:hypothetical protein
MTCMGMSPRVTQLRIGLLGATALALVALIVAVSGPSGRPATIGSPSPGATGSSTGAVAATGSAAASSPLALSTSAPTATLLVGANPDPRYGVIVATGNMRTETDPRGLQDPSLFMTNSAYAVSPDGKRIALIRTSQTGQQVVTFSTDRPNDVTTVVDLAGSGERAVNVVWAGDGSDSVLFAAVKETFPTGGGDVRFEHAAVRAVNMKDRSIREIVRISGQNTRLWPLAWLPGSEIVAAAEIGPRGPAMNYVTVRAGVIERIPIVPNPNVLWFSASRDGERVVVSLQTSFRWWPTDQPSAAKEFTAQGTDRFAHVEFRPGADELGVDVGSAFEIWSLTGQRRVVAQRTPGFLRWRVDGSAAIASSDPVSVWLVDPVTGAKSQLPGGGFPLADVVMFETPR